MEPVKNGARRGACRNYADCGRDYKLRKDGTIPQHTVRVQAGALNERERRVVCWGSKQPPAEGRSRVEKVANRRLQKDYHEAPPRGVSCPFCGRRVRVRAVRGRPTMVCGGCGNRFTNPLGRPRKSRQPEGEE